MIDESAHQTVFDKPFRIEAEIFKLGPVPLPCLPPPASAIHPLTRAAPTPLEAGRAGMAA